MQIELENMTAEIQENRSTIMDEIKGRLLFLGFWGYLALLAIFIVNVLT